MMQMDHNNNNNNNMNISKNALSKEMVPGEEAGSHGRHQCADNSLIKLIGTSFNSPTRDMMVVNSEESKGLLKSLSELFEKDDESGPSLFGSSRWDLQSHSIGEEEELLRSKQKAVKEAYEKWQGSCRSFDQSDDELLNLSASLSDLCASFTVLMNKSKGQFQKFHRASPSKLSNATLQHEIQRLAKIRRELLKAHAPMAVHGKTLKTVEREHAQRQKSRSDRSITLVDAVAADLGFRAAREQVIEAPAKNISDITMSSYRGSGLSHSMSDITLSPFGMESQRQNLSSAVRRALADGAAPCLPTETTNKCENVLRHGTQKSEMAGPQHLKKQQSCDFSPRKPQRSSLREVVNKFEEKTNGGRTDSLCRPTRKVSADNLIPDLMQEPEQLIDQEDASHEEAVLVCPSRPTKAAAFMDSCPLQSGFDDRTMLFRRSQSTPVVTAENAAPPKRPSRARSPSKNEDLSHGRSKSSEPMLPSPPSPRRIKAGQAFSQYDDAGLVVASNQDCDKPVSLAKVDRLKSAEGLTADSKVPSSRRLHIKAGKEKSSRLLEKSPQAKSERQLTEKQKSRQSLAVTESPAKHCKSTRRLKHVSSKEGTSHNDTQRSSTDSENRERPRLVSDFNMGRVQQLVSKMNHTDTTKSSKRHAATKKVESPKIPLLRTKILKQQSVPKKKEFVLPSVTDCFIRMPGEGTMTSSASGCSRDVAPVTPRRFPASFTTSNSCRGFNSKCKKDDSEFSSKEQQQQQQLKREQKDIVLPSLAAADDSRDYSKSPHLSPRKLPPTMLRTSNSCRQFFIDDESINNDCAPVSPRRSTHSPLKVGRDFKSMKPPPFEPPG